MNQSQRQHITEMALFLQGHSGVIIELCWLVYLYWPAQSGLTESTQIMKMVAGLVHIDSHTAV